MAKIDHQIASLISQANNSKLGIEVVVSNIEVFKRRWYATRTLLGAKHLTLRMTGEPNKVWILKESTNAED